MKVIKVIDLLNKIANGEEVPKKITIDKGSYEFEWNGNMYIHRFRNKYGDYCDFVKPDYIHNLDKEIHIIEDTPKIDDAVLREYYKKDTPKEGNKIEKMNFCYKVADEMQNANNERFRDFINEIIDTVNGEDNE